MAEQIVVGYDGSDEARAAFAVAIDRALPSDRIVVVHATAGAGGLTVTSPGTSRPAAARTVRSSPDRNAFGGAVIGARLATWLEPADGASGAQTILAKRDGWLH